MSNSKDLAIATRENKQFALKYKSQLEEAVKRVDKYNHNKFMAYAFLWEKYSLTMQNNIAGKSNFNSKIFKDPIKLLIAIKEHSLNFNGSRYEMSIITKKSFFNTKQKDT